MTADKDALLPCPFCGEQDPVMMPCFPVGLDSPEPKIMGIDSFYVHCDGCGADGPPENNEDSARDLWNARITAALAEKDDGGCKWSPDDDFELGDTWHGECGAMWTFTEGGPAENSMKFCPECGGSVSLPPLPKGE